MTRQTELAKTGKWKGFFNKFTAYKTVLIQEHYINEILKNTKKNDKLLEIATGSGYTSLVLLYSGRKNVAASDIEEELLEDIKEKMPELMVARVNAFDMPYENGEIDCVFHQGFLEHFDDEDIIKLLNEAARVAKKVIFDVPNARRWNKTKEYGNERFMYHGRWKKLIRQSDLYLIKDTARRMPKIFKYLPKFMSENEWFRKHFGTSSIFVCGPK
jgi:ubiquinone/menaquinone biosynthesis C-methylase UbiE